MIFLVRPEEPSRIFQAMVKKHLRDKHMYACVKEYKRLLYIITIKL